MARHCLFGANLQGWASRGESTGSAQPRIITAFGGLPVVRDWANGSTWTWGDRLARYPIGTSLIVEFTPTAWPPTQADLDNFQRLCSSAPTDRTHWITVSHEVELRGKTTAGRPTFYKQCMASYTAIHRANAPKQLRHAAILMGSTYIVQSLPGAHEYPRWLWGQVTGIEADLTPLAWMGGLDVDDLGVDVYQQIMGGAGGTEDTAAGVLQPVIDLARQLDKGIVVGELGALCVDAYRTLNPQSLGVPDSHRAQFLADVVTFVNGDGALVKGHPRIRAICIFEATEGGSANPCCLTPPPDWPGGDYSPLALQVWHDATVASAH